MSVTVGGKEQNSANLDEYGNPEISVSSPRSAFGELLSAEVTPIVQIDAVYGIRGDCETFSASSGSVSVEDGNFVCKTGTTVGGYGVIRSRNNARYRPGQGLLFRWTALFDSVNATALSLQAAGPFNSTNGFFVGYDGTQFGVMHRTGGLHEIRELQVTAAASGAETVSLTLNGVLYSIPVTSGTVQHNAFEIAEWLASNQAAWQAAQNNDKVVLFGANPGPLAGSYSVSSTGTLAGSLTQITAGVANTETWVYQSSFSIDRLDGGGPSGFNLDVSKGNVYQLSYQYLGYGPVTFSIKNPASDDFVDFHRFNFLNSRTSPNLLNPSMKIGWISASLGSSTDISVKGASAMAGLVGRFQTSQFTRGKEHTNTSVGTTLEPIISFRVRLAFQGFTLLKELIPKIAYVSPTGSKSVEVLFLFNPTFSTENNWQYIDENESIVEYDTTATAFTSTGTTVASFVVGGGSTESLSIQDIGQGAFALDRGDVLTIAARVTSGSAVEVSASLTWTED